MTSCILFTSCLYENEWYVLGMSTKVSIKELCLTRSTMANVTVPWQNITVPMRYPYTWTQQPTYLWIHAAWCVHFMLETIEKIAFLWSDNTFHCASCHLSRPCLTPNIHFLAVYCCSHAFRQVIVVSLAMDKFYLRPTTQVYVRWWNLGARSISFWKSVYEVNN
jgi:hypothetical protein